MINAETEKELIKDPIDDAEIKVENDDVRIMTYNDLEPYKNIDELMPKDKEAIMLLYLTESDKSGHWCCLVKNDNNLYYFDSYSKKIDEPLTWDGQHIMKEPYLTNIVDNSPNYNVFENTKQYQKPSTHINTCGRHCLSFIQFNNYYNCDLFQYYEIMNYLKNKMKKTYDELVCHLITENIK